MPRPFNTDRRGFLLVDTITGLILLAAIASLLLTAIVRQGRVAARLAEDRAAVRRAESLLASMAETAGAASTKPADVEVRESSAPAAAGWRWVEVSVPDGGRRVVLTGLARVANAGGGR